MANSGAPFDIYVRGTDTASPAITRAGQSLQRLGTQGRLTSIELFSIGFVLRDLNRGLQQMSRQIIDTAKEVVTMGATFEEEMARVMTQVTGGEITMQEMSTAVLDMSRTTRQATGELADGMFDIFSSIEVGAETSVQLLDSLAKAATAGFTDIETVGRGAISIMNAWGLVVREDSEEAQNLANVLGNEVSPEMAASMQTVDNMNRVLDVQFRMVELGIGEYSDFAGALGNIVPSARAAGQEIEQMGALLAFTTRQGLNTRKASVSLARALDLLTRPQNVIRMKQLFDIDVIDQATGGFRQMSDIVGDLHERFKGMSDPEIINSLAMVFGQGEIRAMRFFKVAIPNFEELNRIVGEFDESSGAMMRAFEKASDTLNFELDVLRNNFDALVKRIGLMVIPTVRDWVEVVDRAVDALHDLDDATLNNVIQISALMGGFTLVATALTTLVGIWARWYSLLKLAGIELNVVWGWLGRLAGVTSVIGIVLAAVVSEWDRFSSALGDAGPSFLKLLDSVNEVIDVLAETFLPLIADALILALETATPIIKLVASALSAVVSVLKEVTPLMTLLAGVIMAKLVASALPALGTALYVGIVAPAGAATTAVRGLHSALTFMASHPILAVLAGVGAILAAQHLELNKAKSAWADIGEQWDILAEKDPALALNRINEEIRIEERRLNDLKSQLEDVKLTGFDPIDKLIPGIGQKMDDLNFEIEEQEALLEALGIKQTDIRKTATEMRDSLIESLDPALRDQAEEIAGGIDDMDEATKAMIEDADKMAGSIRDAFEGASDVFSDFADEAFVSAGEVRSAMEEQLNVMREFYLDLGKLTEAGVSQQFVAKMAEMGPAMAGVVKGMAEDPEIARQIDNLHASFGGLADAAVRDFVRIGDEGTRAMGQIFTETGEMIQVIQTAAGEIRVLKTNTEGVTEDISFAPLTDDARKLAKQLGLNSEEAAEFQRMLTGVASTSMTFTEDQLQTLKAALDGDTDAAKEAKGWLDEVGSTDVTFTRRQVELLTAALEGDEQAAKDAKAMLENVNTQDLGRIKGEVSNLSGLLDEAAVPRTAVVRAVLTNHDNVMNTIARMTRPVTKWINVQTRGEGHGGGLVDPSGLIMHGGGSVPSFQFGGVAREVNARLEAGEFVLRRDAVEALGLPFLRRLNNMRVGQREPQRQAPQPIQVPDRGSREGPTFHIEGRFDTPEEMMDALEWQHLTRGW